MQKQEVKKYLGKFGHGVQNIKWALGSITTKLEEVELEFQWSYFKS